jgi:hypothetical protein
LAARCSAKEEARLQGKTRYFNGVPCKHGHVAERVVASGSCVACVRENRVKYYYANNQKDLMRVYARERRAADPAKERQRAIRILLKSKYGIDEAEYAAMYARQRGCCAICKDSIVSRLDETRPVYSGRGGAKNNVGRVDHCHETGAIRGLLCSNCNLLLGKAKDDERILFGAVRYLRDSATAQARSGAGTTRPQGEIEPRQRDLESSNSRGNRRDQLSPFH